MNAADFLNNQHNTNHSNLNASDFINNGKKFKKPSNKLINDTIRDLNNSSNLKSSISDVTIDDVLYNELDEEKKIIIQNSKKKRKIKKNNKKLFKKYISQQAEIINDSRF